jgi:hypothetical protein
LRLYAGCVARIGHNRANGAERWQGGTKLVYSQDSSAAGHAISAARPSGADADLRASNFAWCSVIGIPQFFVMRDSRFSVARTLKGVRGLSGSYQAVVIRMASVS